ncbi:MAG: peptidylprolyl isomerase [Gammaproteobacteria bacterium]|nr:peptidylprolyl isomerase [Gammaproteobacteria bacterium]
MRATQLLFNLLFLCSLLSVSTTGSAVESLDTILVEINNQIITESELQKRITELRKQILRSKKSAPSRSQLRAKVLDRMVLDALQIERASQYGINLKDAELNSRIENIARQNKISVSGLRNQLIKEGVSFDDFREQVKRATIIARVQKALVFDDIKVSDSEIKQFLQRQKKAGDKDSRYHLSRILISVPEDVDSNVLQQARKKAETVLARLKNGEAFDKLAIELSNGQKALEGGDLGWRAATELPSLYVATVNKLKAGDVSDIIHTPSGFHILKFHASENSKRVIIEETLARHILIKVDELTSDEAARELLESVHKELKNGADFEQMAKQHSQDTASKGSGGSLGWSVPGAFVPQFEAVMKSLQKNQISNVFRSPFGWHIVQVLDRRKSDKTTLIIENKAYQTIVASKSDEALELWLRRLRDEAYIKYHNPSDAAD